MACVFGTGNTFHADWDITLLTVSLTSLVGMRCTLKEHQLDCALCEGNNVMLHRLEAVDVFGDAVFTKTNSAVVAKLLGRFVTV
jgi:hypothetical protein